MRPLEAEATIGIDDTKSMRAWSHKTICELKKIRVDLGQDGFLKVYFDNEMIAEPRIKYAQKMKVGHGGNIRYINDIPHRSSINYVSVRTQEGKYYVSFLYGKLGSHVKCYNGTTAVNEFEIFVDTDKNRFVFNIVKRNGGCFDSFEYIKK